MPPPTEANRTRFIPPPSVARYFRKRVMNMTVSGM